nr:unnamed protein product [Digitaria exilis]
MELRLRDSILLVSLAVSTAALYARAVSSRVRPGPTRLAMLLPVTIFFAAIPLVFSSAVLRCAAALFLSWLGTFKVVLLAVGHGPLDPTLPSLQFVLTTALPIELVIIPSGVHPDKARSMAGPVSTSSLASFTFKVAVIAAITRLYKYFHEMHLYVRLVLYGVHVWCSMELLFAGAAAACRGVLGVEVKPQFDKPYLATSLQDFWGRRWNLPVSAILRASVYDPVRARAGKEAGVVATFVVSGLMHEALVYYFTLEPPTGEMVAFFLLHGVCRVAEDWCAPRWTARGWPAPPRHVARVLVLLFFMATSFSLIFPPVYREGREEMLLKESADALEAFFAGVVV